MQECQDIYTVEWIQNRGPVAVGPRSKPTSISVEASVQTRVIQGICYTPYTQDSTQTGWNTKTWNESLKKSHASPRLHMYLLVLFWEIIERPLSGVKEYKKQGH